MKMKIGTDIDDVLLSFFPKLNEFYNGIYGTSFKFEDYKHFDLEKTWGGTKERAIEIVNAFYNHPLFDNILPIDGSQRAINILSKDNDFSAISYRPKDMEIKTINCIEKYFRKNIKEVILNGQYGAKSSEMSKVDICLDKSIELIIEDNFETAKECSEKGITAFLLDKPWNQNNPINNDNFFRFKNWNEILEKLE